jgi:hypothetical protein
VKEEAVSRVFPGHDFVAVLFRQFPVGRIPPEPLKPSNVYAVSKDNKLTLINSTGQLEEFFKKARPGADEQAKKDAVRAWLRLSQELHQDGFYGFKVEEDSVKAQGETALGKTVVNRGGNGEIAVTLSFKDGLLTSAKEEAKLKPGPRPICQATLLLDPNPLVRRIVEQDLLIMGRMALPYLEEQHARATPELRQAIERIRQRILAEDR